MAKATTEAAAIKRSALWCALEYLGKKRGDRDAVGDGTSTPIAIDISAKVGRHKLTESIVGSLEIGPAQPAAPCSSEADPNELLALVLREVGDGDRQAAVMAKITGGNRGAEITAAELSRVTAWREGLRSHGTKPKRGNLSFMLKAAAAVAMLVCTFAMPGCADPEPIAIPLPPPAAECPVVNLPELMREWNWTDRSGAGSCVHASSIYHFRWQGKLPLAAWWRQKYAGGETAQSIQQIWASNGIPFHATENGDPNHLDWATRTRRGAIIWFFPSHCVHFCGWSTVGGRQYAFLCDNNRIEKYIRVPREEFVQRWREYGGFACTALYAPAPPKAWQPYRLVASH